MDKGEINRYKPFSITARSEGFPRKLYTPLVLVNLEAEDSICASVVNAMWDTGAECCVMSRSLADRMGYVFQKRMMASGIGGGRTEALFGYACVTLIGNGGLIDTLAAIVDEELGEDYSFIIGLDLIRKGTLAISHVNLDILLSDKKC